MGRKKIQKEQEQIDTESTSVTPEPELELKSKPEINPAQKEDKTISKSKWFY